jgi:hypothetical protein
MNVGETLNWITPAFAIMQNVLRGGYTVSIDDPDEVLSPAIVKEWLARAGVYETWGWDYYGGRLIFSVPNGTEAQVDEVLANYGSGRKDGLALAWLWVVVLALLLFTAWAVWPMVGMWLDGLMIEGGA